MLIVKTKGLTGSSRLNECRYTPVKLTKPLGLFRLTEGSDTLLTLWGWNNIFHSQVGLKHVFGADFPGPYIHGDSADYRGFTVL